MEAPAIPHPVIQLSDVRLVYVSSGRSLTVLDIPRWEVARGSQVAVYGPSGSGKSTLLHLLSGVLGPTTGSLRVCEVELASLGEAARDQFRAEHIGYVFQGHNLLPGYTALENVLLGASFVRRKVGAAPARELLAAMALGERLHHLPSMLSLGEQQRVAIARALVKRPALVLADEPTASLDPRSSARILELLRTACQQAGSTLVLVTHEREVLAQFEHQVDFIGLNQAWQEVEGRA